MSGSRRTSIGHHQGKIIDRAERPTLKDKDPAFTCPTFVINLDYVI